MKLLTKAILDQFKKIWNQDDKKSEDVIIVAKFFNPTGAGTWYASEYDEERECFFGYVSIFGDHNDEWGGFTLYDLESFKWKFGLGIERDLHFEPKKFSELNLNNQ